MAHLLNVEAYASYIGVTYGNLSEDRKFELNGQRLLELKLQDSQVSGEVEYQNIHGKSVASRKPSLLGVNLSLYLALLVVFMSAIVVCTAKNKLGLLFLCSTLLGIALSYLPNYFQIVPITTFWIARLKIAE